MRPSFRSWYDNKMYATEQLAAETDAVEQLLPKIKTIAIVGISSNEHKDSHFVGRYLKHAGYTIFPVNPGASTILGEVCYPDLKSIPAHVDVVNIFRRPEDIPAVVEEALNVNPSVIWCQLGTGEHPELAERVAQKGIRFIQNRCIKVDHQFLISG